MDDLKKKVLQITTLRLFLWNTTILVLLSLLFSLQRYLRLNVRGEAFRWSQEMGPHAFLFLSVLLFVPILVYLRPHLEKILKNRSAYLLLNVVLSLFYAAGHLLFVAICFQFFNNDHDHVLEKTIHKVFINFYSLDVLTFGLCLILINTLRKKDHSSEDRTSSFLQSITFKDNGIITAVSVDQIIWCETLDHYIRFFCQDGTHMKRYSMKNLEARLDHCQFYRIHRSKMVNKQWVESKRSLGKGRYEIRLKNGQVLTSSRSYLGQVKKL